MMNAAGLTEIHEQHPGICAGGLEVLQNVMQGKRDSIIDGSVGPVGELVRVQLSSVDSQWLS